VTGNRKNPRSVGRHVYKKIFYFDDQKGGGSKHVLLWGFPTGKKSLWQGSTNGVGPEPETRTLVQEGNRLSIKRPSKGRQRGAQPAERKEWGLDGITVVQA